MSRYPDCALTRYLAENRLSVGLMAGSLLTMREAALDQVLLDQVDERAEAEDDLPVADADRAAALPGQRLDQLLVHRGVGLDPDPGELRARHYLVHLAVNESGDRAADRRAEGLQQRPDPRQSMAGQQAGGLIGVRGHVEVGGDLGRDLVGERVLDGRIVDQRLHVGHVTAGARDLVSGPDGQHRERSQQAADHDENDRDRGPPADVRAAGGRSVCSVLTSARSRSSSARSSGLRLEPATAGPPAAPPASDIPDLLADPPRCLAAGSAHDLVCRSSPASPHRGESHRHFCRRM